MCECIECANNDTLYCSICENNSFYMTQEEKESSDYLCDLMCGHIEEDS